MTCNDCIHHEVCENAFCWIDPNDSSKRIICHKFKAKSNIIELPCKVGDIYYTIEKYCNTDPYETEKEIVKSWDCEKYCGRFDCSFSEYRIEEHKFASVIDILKKEQDFGKTVFLTKEEAEKTLAERSKL